jgi:hypothetical protein
MLISELTTTSNKSIDAFFTETLQSYLTLSINNKLIKKGRLILFKRVHFFIQLSFLSDKNTIEHLELPIPFDVEDYFDEGLVYFDYRIRSLRIDSVPEVVGKVTSTFFDKILEITVS